MDRIIRVTLSVLIVVLVAFVAAVGYSGYTENAYRTSLASFYTYSCTVSTDSLLSNVTFFIPVPADGTGNSPIIVRFSGKEITGVPDTWTTALYDTGKATLVKVTVPEIVPPAGTTHTHPYEVTLSATVSSRKIIDTRDPVENSPMFRPVTDLTRMECMSDARPQDNRQCYSYLTSVYADYHSRPDATVSIAADLRGGNSWNLFGPRENAYNTTLYLLMLGENHGWTTARGYLEQGIGSDDPVRQTPVSSVTPV